MCLEGKAQIRQWRRLKSCQGGNAFITPGQVKAALDRQRFDMILMRLEMPPETVYETCRMAGERNIPVFLNAGPAMALKGVALAALAAGLVYRRRRTNR